MGIEPFLVASRARLRRRPAPGAHAVPALQAAHDHLRRGPARQRLPRRASTSRPTSPSAARAAAARLQGPHRPLRGDDGHRGDPRRWRSSARRPTRSPRSRCAQGMRRLREDGLEKVSAGPHLDRRDRPRDRHRAAAVDDVDVSRHARACRTSDRRAMNFDFADPAHGGRRAPRLRPAPHRRRAADGPRPRPPRARSRATRRLTPTDTREIVYSILTNDQRQRLETDWQLDFAYSIPGHGPLPRQRLLPAPRASAPPSA